MRHALVLALLLVPACGAARPAATAPDPARLDDAGNRVRDAIVARSWPALAYLVDERGFDADDVCGECDDLETTREHVTSETLRGWGETLWGTAQDVTGGDPVCEGACCRYDEPVNTLDFVQYLETACFRRGPDGGLALVSLRYRSE